MRVLQITKAKNFLNEFLKEGPMKVPAIYDKAYCLGLNEKIVDKAKRELKVKSVKLRDSQAKMIYCWQL